MIFARLVALLAAPLPVSLAVSNLSDPMSGGHTSQSTDLLSMSIDGGNWRFDTLSRWFYGPGRGRAPWSRRCTCR